MNTIRIEECPPSRLNELLYLTRETIRISYAGHYPREAVRYFLDYHSPESILGDLKEGHAVVVIISGAAVGTGTLRETTVKRVFVLPEFQGKGIGKMIMGHLEDYATRQGLRILELHASLPAKRFYDSLGYRTLRFCHIPVGKGKTLDYYRMARPIGRERARPAWNLQGKSFAPSSGTGLEAGAVDRGLFVFFQQNETVLALRTGTGKGDGELIGFIEGDRLSFRFEDLNVCGMIGTGCGEARIERSDGGRIRLAGEWRSKKGKGLFAFKEEA